MPLPAISRGHAPKARKGTLDSSAMSIGMPCFAPSGARVKRCAGALYALEAPKGITEKRAHTKAALADAAEQFVPPLRIYLQNDSTSTKGGSVVMIPVFRRQHIVRVISSRWRDEVRKRLADLGLQ